MRWANEGEELETLDGSVRKLESSDLVIVDAAGPTSLAAVMGGARSEVRESTHRVIMEAASWNAPTVMYTSRRHDLRSEASVRFERGVDPNLALDANTRACQLLLEVGGGSVLADVIDVVANPAVPLEIDLELRDVIRLLGDGFTLDRCAQLLRRLELGVEAGENSLRVTVPTNRPDLTHPADLVEEIARLADFDTFEETLPTGPAGGLLAEQQRNRAMHEIMRGAGLSQAINLPFVSDEELAAFSDAGSVSGVVTVRNPLREDQSKLRQSLLPGLLRRLRENRNRGSESVALFETGRVFYGRPWADDTRVPDQPMRLAAAIIGRFGTERLGETTAAADVNSAVALISLLSSELGVKIDRRQSSGPGFHPTRTARLLVADSPIGYAGELHPDVADEFDLGGRVAVIELDIAPLLAEQPYVQMRPVSNYPHVDFDLSFEIANEAAAGDLASGTAGLSPLVEKFTIFDDYREATAGLRAVAIRYRLRAPDRTLGADEIAAVRTEMIGYAASRGASLRGAEG